MNDVRYVGTRAGKGQVTIPSEIRRKLKLKKGDLVMFVETEAGVLIKPAEILVSNALDEIGRALEARGIDLDEFLARVRENRTELIEKEYGLNEEWLMLRVFIESMGILDLIILSHNWIFPLAMLDHALK